MNEELKSDRLFDSVLKTVKENWTYLKENPKHLAWCMMNFELIHSVGRQMGECQGNPKYDIEWLEEWCQKESNDGALLYDSWAITIGGSCEFPDFARNNVPKADKINKTMEDWVDVCTHKDYKYKSIYPDRKRVIDDFLCTNGTGIGWNKEGYMDDLGPCHVPSSVFYGYTMCEEEVPKKIREKILSFKNDPYIKSNVDEYMRKVEINWNGTGVEKEILEKGDKVKNTVIEKCKKLKIKCTDALIKRFQDAYEYCVYISHLSARYGKMSEEEKEEARITNIYKDETYEFDLSNYSGSISDVCYSFEYDVERHLRNIKSGKEVDVRTSQFGHVEDVWSDFVFKKEIPNDKVEEVKKIEAEIRSIMLSEKKDDVKRFDELQKEMDKYRPNSKYRELYEKAAIEGCKESIDKMNKIVGYENNLSGFKLFEEVIISRKLKREKSKFFKKDTNEYKTYYPMSPNYCRLSDLPQNAHESYFNGCFEVCVDILNHIDEEVNTTHGIRYGNVKLSLEFISKYSKRFNIKEFDFKYSEEDEDVDSWKKISSEIIYNDGKKLL